AGRDAGGDSRARRVRLPPAGDVRRDARDPPHRRRAGALELQIRVRDRGRPGADGVDGEDGPGDVRLRRGEAGPDPGLDPRAADGDSRPEPLDASGPAEADGDVLTFDDDGDFAP